MNPFKCFLCGVCCRKFRVVINIDEGKHLAKKMGMDWNEFLNNYLDTYYVATDRFLIRQIKGSCIFLKQFGGKQALCSINDFKPSSCIEWSAGISRPECKSGLSQTWNLEISPDGEIMGKEIDIRNFNSFLNSIA